MDKKISGNDFREAEAVVSMKLYIGTEVETVL